MPGTPAQAACYRIALAACSGPAQPPEKTAAAGASCAGRRPVAEANQLA
jgi:hypothetical protein